MQYVESAQKIVWDPNNLTYQLELTLPHANTHYNITIWARSSVAENTDKHLWSPSASTIFKTLPDRNNNLLLLH